MTGRAVALAADGGANMGTPMISPETGAMVMSASCIRVVLSFPVLCSHTPTLLMGRVHGSYDKGDIPSSLTHCVFVMIKQYNIFDFDTFSTLIVSFGVCCSRYQQRQLRLIEWC